MTAKPFQEKFPQTRLRRLRSSPAIRHIFTETHFHKSSLVAPFFVTENKTTRTLGSLPSHPQYALSDLLGRLDGFVKKGGKSIILFGLPRRKDTNASEAYSDDGVVQNAVRQIKNSFGSDLVVMTDLCFCEYTDHGHCGILKDVARSKLKVARQNKILKKANALSSNLQLATCNLQPSCDVDNDATLKIIAKTAVSQAQAGADIIAPSGMMDGQIKTIREALDANDCKDTLILSYAAKYASSLYGPFRDLAQSKPGFGNRKGYQMNPANAREALREIALDVEEGADMAMVKPASFYLDVLAKARARFDLPLAAFQVSGEAWMIEQYAKNGFAKRQDIVLESITAIKRAGADLIISYFTEELLGIL